MPSESTPLKEEWLLDAHSYVKGYSWFDLLRKLVCETMGTFFLVFTITLSAGQGSELAPLAIGAVLMAQVFCFGHISGGMFNPAVSFAVFIRGKLRLLELVAYIVAQLVGAFIAALSGQALLNDFVSCIQENSLTPCAPGFPAKHQDVSYSVAIAAEAIWTFALCSVVLNCATTKAQADNSFFGLAIGFTVLGGAVSVGHLTGGAFNPAVGTALPAVDGGSAEDISIYWIGPMLGALFAGLIFRFVTAAEDDRHGN